MLVSSLVKELLDGDVDIVNVPIAEAALRSEGDVDDEGGGLVDGDEEAESVAFLEGFLPAFLSMGVRCTDRGSPAMPPRHRRPSG